MDKEFIKDYGRKIDRMVMSLNINYLDYLEDLMIANDIVIAKMRKCNMRILWALNSHGTMTIGKLAETVGITNKNIHHYVSRLMNEGYVTRKAAPNNFTLVLVELTDKGKTILQEGNDFSDKVMLQLFNARLSDAEQIELAKLTERITELYDKLGQQ